MKNPTCQWFYITVILYGIFLENTASSTSTANVTSTTMKLTSSTVQPDTPSTSSASPIDSSEAPSITSSPYKTSSIPSNTSSSLPTPSSPPTTLGHTTIITKTPTSKTNITTEAPVSETTITNEATTIKKSTTTEAPTNKTINTTELPANVTTTTTELPANVTTTTTELPTSETTTPTELITSELTSTTEPPTSVTTTTTELPTTETITTTKPTTSDATSPTETTTTETIMTTDPTTSDTTTTTELTTSDTATTTELPTSDTATTTELPTSDTATTTELPTSDTATTTELTTSDTATTTELPTSDTATTTELPTSATATTTELPTIELTTPTEPTTIELTTTTEPTTIELTTTTEPTTIELTTPTEPTTIELTTTTEPTTIELTTTTEPTTIELTTTTEPTTIELTTPTEPTTIELTTPTEPTTIELTTPTEPTTIELTTPTEPTTIELTTTTELTTIETTTEILTTSETTTEEIETTAYASTMPTKHNNTTSVETSTPTFITTPVYKCRTLSAPEHGTVTKADGDNLYSEATFKCNVGYNIEGSNTSKCLFVNGTEPEPEWIPEPPTCKIVDCGPWNSTINNYVTYTATTYQSTAVSICYTGYAAHNRTSTSTTCLADGTWEKPSPPHCLTTLECEFFNHTGVNVNFTQAYQVNSTATFTCPSGFAVIGYKSITCKTPGVWSAKPPKCQKVVVNTPNCEINIDSFGLQWNTTLPGEIATTSCRKIGYSGQISRRCSTAGRWLLPVYDCISEKIAHIDTVVENLGSKENVTENDLTNALDTLNTATNASGAGSEDVVYSGELEKVTSILDTIVNISEKVAVTEEQSQSFVNIASNLLNTKNTASWQSISEDESESGEADPDKPRGAAKILDVVGKYSDVIVRSLNSTKTNTTVETKNLVLHASKIANGTDVKFPDGHKDLNLSTKFELSKDDATGINDYSAIVYKNISGIMSSRTSSDGNNSESLHDINSAVMSIKMSGLSSNFKIIITFGHLDSTSYTGPMCSFWNTTINAWSNNGCSVVKDGESETVCECKHLTNFAILMSPWTEKNVISKAMDIISTIGCSVSLLGLLLTVIIHIVLWRHLRSDRVVLLMNLSVALIVSYCLFIGGVDRTENKDLCTAIAVLLHYIYLAVFFLMLAEGIELAVILLSAFSSLKSRLKWMIPSAWLIPAIIVAISIGATQLEGYGNEQTCWLTVDQGLIWSFVGPALTVILVNFVLLVISLKAMFGVKSLADKSRAEKARTGLRTLCILLPLMGCTWVIGIFYVNENLDWIQYVFAVCNSLQGLVIFVMHVLCNKQVAIAIQKRRRLYYQSSLASKKTTSSFSMPRATLSQDSGNYSMDGFRKRSPSSTYDSIQTSKYF